MARARAEAAMAAGAAAEMAETVAGEVGAAEPVVSPLAQMAAAARVRAAAARARAAEARARVAGARARARRARAKVAVMAAQK